MTSAGDEAERRIDDARKHCAVRLDLGDLALTELPAGLGNLPHIETLYLGLNGLDDAGRCISLADRERASFTALAELSPLIGLRYLDLCGSFVKDLSPLSGLVELRHLDLSITEVTNLAVLPDFAELEHLDLSFGCISDLSALSSLSKLRFLDLSETSVADLSVLSRLAGLRHLGLGGTQVTDLSVLSSLVVLEHLDLNSIQVNDLSVLSSLAGLKYLDLSNTRVADLSALTRLVALERLNLSVTRVDDLLALSGLAGLKHLDFSSTQVTDLSPLYGLVGLKYLDLSSTQVTDLSVLSSLTGLEHLCLRHMRVTDLWALSGLAGLKHLDLRGAKVADLSALSGLARLEHLDLRAGRVTDLAALSGLARLKYLDLSGTQVINLSPLSGLVGLKHLDLSVTQVTNLSPLSGLAELESLALHSTQVSNLSVLSKLRGIQELKISNCRLVKSDSLLRDVLDHPSLAVLVVTHIAGVPREVLSRTSYDNCLQCLRSWHSELGLGVEAENEVKIILLGNGHVGKTQLCRRFRGELFDTSVESTHGVQLWRESLQLTTDSGQQTFMVNWWDFGGQDIYHGTHALFLRSRAIFVLLWNPRLEQRQEFIEDGIPVRNQPLAYWLDYVRSLAGADSPVIVVQSQCDGFADRAADPHRPEGFGFFETCAYSAANNRGRDVLESHLHEAIRYLKERGGAVEIGRGRAEVRRRLYVWRSDDQQRPAAQRQHRTLTAAQFQSLCDEVGDIVSWQHALDYFHQTGVVFYNSNLFADCIILDQDWALDAVYAVFHRGRAVPWLRDSGRFTQEDLNALVWQAHSASEQTLFLGLMESCGVCFTCGKSGRGEVRYLAPDLLPSLDHVQLPAWNESAEMVTLELQYRFFHPAVIRGLMQQVAKEAGEKGEYWKFGFWFKDGKRDAQLRVKFVDVSNQETPGGGVLVLEAQGRDPLMLLAEIRRSILRGRLGELPEERLTLAGITVARADLGNVVEGRVLAMNKQLVPAARFIAFFDGKEIDAKMDIDPKPLSPADKRPEVFISYAWGDDSPEGQRRSQAVDGLQAALEQDGFTAVRDKDQIRPGERISAFLRRLTRADLIVTLISDKYLHSYYCMYEMYKLWQKAQADADQMMERLVPLILPEVRLGDLEQRAPYLKYWAQRATLLETLARDPDIRPSSQSWEEVRLVREFAHHVDEILVFLNDVLMPRKLDEHIANDFQAVRDVLRRHLTLPSR